MYEKKMNIKDKDDKTDKEANEKFKYTYLSYPLD